MSAMWDTASGSDGVDGLANTARRVITACRQVSQEFEPAVSAASSALAELETLRNLKPWATVDLSRFLNPLSGPFCRILGLASEYANTRGKLSTTQKMAWKMAGNGKLDKEIVLINQAIVDLAPIIKMAQDARAREKQAAPQQQNPKECPIGVGCRKYKCQHSHPNGPKFQAGKDCEAKKCRYAHPRVEECRFQASCTKKDAGTCRHAHLPPGTIPVQGDKQQRSNGFIAPRAGTQNSSHAPNSIPTSAPRHTPRYTPNAPPVSTSFDQSSSSQTQTRPWGSRGGSYLPQQSADTKKEKCPYSFKCKNYYTCKKWHPRRKPCPKGPDCEKGQNCTFHHSKSAPPYSKFDDDDQSYMD